jgi:hypothetical protein
MNGRLCATIAFLIVIGLLPWKTVTGAPTENVITGVYTDMRRHPQTGDILGVELFVVQANRGFYVYFQDAEGSPKVPLTVPAKIENHRIEFELPERDGYAGIFQGVISGSGITGHFINGQQSSFGKRDFVLRKGKSFWQ